MVINKDNYIGAYNMTTEKIKRMLDACYQAKRIRELLPPLPQGVTPSYIQYLDNIHALGKQGIQVKISDISDVMNLPRPGVTRTVIPIANCTTTNVTRFKT